MTGNGKGGPALRGTSLAFVSAIAFGVTTPLVQRLGRDVGPFATAFLLYAGAAAAGAALRGGAGGGVRRGDLSRVLAMAALGAGLAPALLAWGLARTSGTSASLTLNLEAVFTIALARCMFHEHVGRRVALASLVLLAAGALLVVERARGAEGAASALGLGAVALASLAWALDNALSKPLSGRDPSSVVVAKCALGACLSVAFALALGERWPPLARALGLVLVGAVGYGTSLRLYLLAQRSLGAGRTASVFASAPFCGALLALALGEPAGPLTAVAAAAMVFAIVLHATEEHEHPHLHHAATHDHVHRHDDGHHDHTHDPMPVGEHSHPHHHETVRHAHSHVPDLHHEHDHD